MNKHCNMAYHIFNRILQIKMFPMSNSVIILCIIDAHSLACTKRGASHTISRTFTVIFADYFIPVAYDQSTSRTDIGQVTPMRHPYSKAVIPYPSIISRGQHIRFFQKSLRPIVCSNHGTLDMLEECMLSRWNGLNRLQFFLVNINLRA